MPMYVGEAAVDAVVTDGHLRVVDAQQVQDCGCLGSRGFLLLIG